MSSSGKIDVTKIPDELLHPACIQCIKDRTLKEDIVNPETKEVMFKKGEFAIDCRGILNEKGYRAMAESVMQDSTEGEIQDQVEILRNAFDKVYWAKQKLGWEPRVTNELFGFYPVQEVALNCTAKRKVYRLGRRFGKCVGEDSLIWTDHGSIKAKDLDPSIHKIITSSEGLKLRYTSDYKVFDNGVKEVFRIETKFGTIDYLTGNHPYLVLKNGLYEWVEVDDLILGDLVAIVENHSIGYIGTIIFSPVISKDYVGLQPTFDLTVPETHNFVANGTVTHNTDLMAVEASHSVATSARDATDPRRIGAKVTFITPAETQRKEIFDRIRVILYEKMGWQKGFDVKRDTNSPYPEIISSSNAVIQAFVTGASSGSDGTSIRGKGGDKNFWDEAEFIRAEHYAIMMPLLAEDPNVELVVSSTPKEANGIFYKFCKDPTYREFHYPSTALDFWTPQIDYDQRKFLGPIQYRQEILAEFGSVDESVFSDEARAGMFVGPRYSDVEKDFLDNRADYIIGLGVDWNGSLNGNQLCIMARKKETQKKIIVNRLAIKGEEIQTRSLNKIRELNQKWKFDFIYVDNGFGGVQIEMLHKIAKAAIRKFGKDHADSNLRKVKGINFQGKVKLKDPLTRKEEAKFVKVFMVDTMLLELEDLNIQAAKEDEELNNQMAGYKIARILESGSPKYQAGTKTLGDHALDAVMLASLGFRLEFGDLDPSVYFGHGIALDPYEQLEIEELLDRNNYVSDKPTGVLRKGYPSGNIKETLRPIDRTADLQRSSQIQREQPSAQSSRNVPIRSNYSGHGRAISLRRR